MIDIILGLATTHIGGPDDLNEDNNLIGVQYEEYFIGTMYNSQYNRSYFAGREYQINDNWGILLGAVSGYDTGCMKLLGNDDPDCDNPSVIPLLTPYVKYKSIYGMLHGNAFMVAIKF